MSDVNKQEEITIEPFNELVEALDDMDDDALHYVAERASHLGAFAVARSTALMEENAKLKKLLSEAYAMIGTHTVSIDKICDEMMDDDNCGTFEDLWLGADTSKFWLSINEAFKPDRNEDDDVSSSSSNHSTQKKFWEKLNAKLNPTVLER